MTYLLHNPLATVHYCSHCQAVLTRDDYELKRCLSCDERICATVVITHPSNLSNRTCAVSILLNGLTYESATKYEEPK